MGNHDSSGDNKPFVQIKPAELTLSSAASDRGTVKEDKKTGKTFGMGILIGGLTGLTLLVILLLPDHIKKPAAPDITDQQTVNSRQAAQAKPETSPWQEAQLGKQRKVAQDVLEKMLDRQFQLEEIAVTKWAGEDFARAMAMASEGDEYYRSREFESALATYEAGLQLMEQLLGQKEMALTNAISTGTSAIEQGDSTTAADAFELALAIDPDSQEAQQGLQRAKVLDNVQQLVAKAEQLEQGGSIIEALSVLQQAAGLDPAQGSVGHSIARLRAVLDQREFKRRMTAGYQALGRESHQEAIAHFQAAIKLDPKAVEAQEALRQAQNERNIQSINGHLAKAEQFQGEEKWQQAVGEYDQALEIDANLLVVQKNRKETATRARLDAALQDAVNRPERLSSDLVWKAGQVLYREASAMENPGPRLSKQIVTLQAHLKYAITPIEVTFSSDNLSQVKLNKVAQLGSFVSRKLELKPGDYVIIASREGYRDVRKEFTVAPRSQSMQLTIQCEEQI
jgi:tetratricopeptide (TPR) repeat protein